MKLAHIVLRTDRVGNSVRRTYVTPAQVMIYVAEHRPNVGGDPILSCDEVKRSTVNDLLKSAQEEQDKLQAQLQKLEADEQMDISNKERRIANLQTRISSLDERLGEIRNILALYDLDASTEKVRLMGIFTEKKIRNLLAGDIPNLPTTFEQARAIGMRSVTNTARLVTVGDEGPGQ